MGVAERDSLGEVLRRLREAAGLSQEELAARAGLSSHAISALERGTRTRPYPHTVRALSDALGASAEDRARLVAAVPARSTARKVAGDAAAPRARELPVPATPLLGRDAEVGRVRGLVSTHRLVTLTGTGGVGKTRLALAVAGTEAAGFADGTVLVELAPLLDPVAVLPAIADAVDATPAPGADVVSSVAEALRHRQMLLLLDNAEHLLAAAPDVAALVEAAPGLTVLVTSRAPLRIRGEVEVAVEPLALPAARRAAEVYDAPASRLLLERAAAVNPGWGRADVDAPAVATICERLAGIPLALELAAARARLLGPAALLARLDSALLEGARDLPARQRTMRATLDWSYALLDPDEQALLRLLAAFVGGFRLDDLEAVAARAGLPAAARVLPHLESLVEQSLVVADGTRFRLLEPVAQYARARLDEAGEADAATRAHARHFLALAEEIAPHYRDGDQVAALARVDEEHPNLTAATERTLAAGDPVTPARLAWALWMYWWLRGHLTHGRRLAEAVLVHDLPDGVRARAELAAATMTFALDDLPAARAWWTSASAHSGDDEEAKANAVAGSGSPTSRLVRSTMPRQVPRGAAARRTRRPRWRVDLGADPRLAGHRRPAARRRRRGGRPGRDRSRVRASPRRPPVGVHRPLQPLPGRARPRPSRRRPAAPRGRGAPLPGDRRPGQPRLPARRAGGPRRRRGGPRAGPAPPGCRPGDPRGDRLLRLRLLPAAPGRDGRRRRGGAAAPRAGQVRRRPGHRPEPHARARGGAGRRRPRPGSLTGLVHRSHTCCCPWSGRAFGLESGGTANPAAHHVKENP
jgi:predicted ATPase/transcriptional regulator with XRE-family HTH domain